MTHHHRTTEEALVIPCPTADLDGPSIPIRVEPIRLPEPARTSPDREREPAPPAEPSPLEEPVPA